MIDLEEKYLIEISKTIRKYFPEAKILVFGSRLTKNHKRYADIDISLDDGEKLDFIKYRDLMYDFAVGDLPIIVDVCDLNSVSPEFRQIILSNYEILE